MCVLEEDQMTSDEMSAAYRPPSLLLLILANLGTEKERKTRITAATILSFEIVKRSPEALPSS
jgi:hypothetical protein